MSRDYAALAPNHVLRKDREVSDEEWIVAFLHRAPMAATATTDGEGQPFINSNLFVYDEAQHCIYIHTARMGRTRSNILNDGRVCLSISEMGRLLPAKTALEFSVEYAGVAVFGTAELVTDEAEAAQGLQLLLNKYFPHLRPDEHYRPVVAEELKRTSVYRINIEMWSGKRKKVDGDVPGAFLYPATAS